MFTDAEAMSDFGWAFHSASSPDTAAYCFTGRHGGTPAHSAASPYTTADAYGLAAPNSSAAALVSECESRVTSDWELATSQT